jgi:hypothetical protein
VFDHNNGIANLDKLVEDSEENSYILEVEPGGRFV